MKYNIIEENKGYLLIEAIIGIGIAITGILGMLNILSRSVSLNRVIGDQLVGNYLAAEGIEITKNIIDGNIIQGNPWNQGFVTGTYEVDYSSLNLTANQNRRIWLNPSNSRYSYQQIGNQTSFIRTINIQTVSSQEIKVNSIVSWVTRGNAQFSVNLEDHFFNWR
jgi:hypothetical protein